MSNINPSQADKILIVLQERRGRNVPMPELYMASGAMAVHSRVTELRKRGHNIVNTTDTGSDGRTKHSFYRLI